MIIVNDLGDQAVYDLIVKSNNYSSGADYSVTELQNPPRIVHLRKRHWDQIEVSASSLVWSLWGRLGHLALEQMGGGLTEERIHTDISGVRLSGQADHYVNGEIVDYKFTKTGALFIKEKYHEWEQQLNSYVWLFRGAGYDVRSARIVAILKDWDGYNVGKKDGYPPSAVSIVPIPIWKDRKTESFIHCLINELEKTKHLSDEDLPFCQPKDMWERNSGWAVKPEGGKRALKVFPTEVEAIEYTNQNQSKYSRVLNIEERKGSRVRCESYCNVNTFCNQYQQYKGE